MKTLILTLLLLFPLSISAELISIHRTETDTLDSVSDRGSTTDQTLTAGGFTTTGIVDGGDLKVLGTSISSTTNGSSGSSLIGIAAGTGSPTVDQIQEYFDNTGSSGFFLGGELSDGGSGTLNVAAGEGFIRTTSDDNAPLLSFKWSASSGIAVADDTTQYVFVDDAGAISLNVSEFLEAQDKILIGVVTDEAGVIESVFQLGVRLEESIGQAGRFIRRIHSVVRDVRRGGLVFGETGTRNLTLTAGHLWWGRTDYTISALDTSGDDRFDLYYRASPSGWTKVADQSQWPNTQYDDGTGTLNTMTNDQRWAVLWLYIEPDDQVVVVYGRDEYLTQGLADEESPPNTLPPRLSATGFLAARLVFQRNAATATFDAAFDIVFVGSAVTDHGNLSGLLDDDHTQYVQTSDSIDVISDVETTDDAPNQNEVLKWNGSQWVPGTAGDTTEFTFTFDSFGDDQTSQQLIGSGEWLAIGGITFSATYTNGPPTSMVVVVSGDFDGGSGSGWTDNELTFAAGAKTSQASLEANNYPDDALDAITFTATADAEPTKMTAVTFWNQFRYDGVVTGTYNQAFIDALSGSDLDNDSTQTASSSGWSVVMGGTEYTFFAAPSRFSLNTAQFRYATGGEELQAAFTEVGSNVSWQNSAGYSENYDVFKSTIQDMADGTVGIGQSAERLRYYWGHSAVSSGFDETEVEAISDNTINQSNDSTQAWGQVNPVGDYLNLAVSADAPDLTVAQDYEDDGDSAFLFAGITVAMNTKEIVSVTNEFGYVQNYDVYGGTLADPNASANATFQTLSNRTRSYVYTGVSAVTTNINEAQIEALSGTSKIVTTVSDLFDDYSMTASAGEYIWLAIPKRLGVEITDYEFFDGAFPFAFLDAPYEEEGVTNFNGFSEDYYTYRSEQANLGSVTVTISAP